MPTDHNKSRTRQKNSDDPKPAWSDDIKTIGGVVALMTGIFVLFQFILPANLAQPIGTIAVGLILTWVFVKLGTWKAITAFIIWGIAAIMIIAIYFLIIVRPTTVVSRVVDGTENPIPGLKLTLTDSNGVEHKTTTDESGSFKIPGVPPGKFFIYTGSELLFSGDIPTGWRRLIDWTEKPGGSIVYKPPTPTATPITTIVPQTESLTATPAPTPTPWSFWNDICLLCTDEIANPGIKPIATEYRSEGAPNNILSINDTSQECAHTGEIGIYIKYDLRNKTYNVAWIIYWKSPIVNKFNASQYKFLVFFVKGLSGGETFLIGAKDANGIVVTLPSDRYALLDSSVWTSVKVPLNEFFNPSGKAIDWSSLDNISISFDQRHGTGEICVDDFSFRQ